MWCLTKDEATAWCKGNGFQVEPWVEPCSESQYRKTGRFRITAPLAKVELSQHTWFSNFIASSIEPYDSCLMWVTLTGVWPSSENWHLFYRLRETYGERRQLHDAPAHLFLKHERADLATLIGLSLLYGWDFHLLPTPAYMTGFVSHDGFVHLYTGNKDAATSASDALDRARIGGTLLSPEMPDNSPENALSTG